MPFSRASLPLQNPLPDIKVSEPVRYLLTFLYFTCKCQDLRFEFHGEGGCHRWLSCIYLPSSPAQWGLSLLLSLHLHQHLGHAQFVTDGCAGNCVGCVTLPFVGLDPEVYWWEITVTNFICSLVHTMPRHLMVPFISSSSGKSQSKLEVYSDSPGAWSAVSWPVDFASLCSYMSQFLSLDAPSLSLCCFSGEP